MKKSIAGKMRVFFFCALMIFIQLIAMTGCSKTDIVQEFHEPIIDNDLVVDVVWHDITFKVGESWNHTGSESCMYLYPGTDILYFVSVYATFGDHVNEENYITYAVDYIRDTESVDSVLVTESMVPYITADGRDAFISRLRLTQSGNGLELIHDADLVIIPDKNFFALFNVVYEPGEAVPLDIREVVDTATFDLGPSDCNVVAGFSFYDEDWEALIDFTDSEKFVTYLDYDNRDILYSYGTYEFYMGEDAKEHVSEMKEYGLTKEEIEEVMPYHLGQYSEIGNHFQGERVEEEDFIAIVFELEGAVDEEGNEKVYDETVAVLYIGFYIQEYDALHLLNCKTYHWYYLEKEETSE